MIPQSSNFQNANAQLAKIPWHLFLISGFGSIYTFGYTGLPGAYPWISKMGALNQRVDDLNGSSTISDLAITVIDKNQAITNAFPNFTFEGQTATILTGFPGLTYPSDYLTVAALIIDRVESSDDNTTYTFYLVDYSIKLQNLIYRYGDDGWPTCSDDPKTVYGNPMDILSEVLLTEIPLNSSQVNTAAIAAYKAGLFAGSMLRFTVTNTPTAKDFLDREIFKALGGYSFQNYAGQFTPYFYIPNAAPSIALTLTDHNLDDVPSPGEATLIDIVNYRLDYDGSKFRSEFDEVYGRAVNIYGLQNVQTIEGRGVQSSCGGWGYARNLANTLFLRYGGDPLTTNPNKTLTLDVTTFWTGVILEPGDFVYVTHPLVPNRRTGTMGVTQEMFEVLEIQKDFEKGTVKLKLLDVNWMNPSASGALSAFQIAPDSGVPNWPSASGAQRAEYMFISSAATGLYSTGDAGQKIF
jgi:hypothetical protein